MRNMSFSLTTPQFLDGSKTVTRRLGWRFLKVGEHFMAVEKAQGLKKGEKVKRLGECVCMAKRYEALDCILDDPYECQREGFPRHTPQEFVGMFCKAMRCDPSQEVTRIEFKRISSTTLNNGGKDEG